MLIILADDESFTVLSTGSVRGKRATYYSVKAKPVAGLELRSLFPNVEQDDTPSPRMLQRLGPIGLELDISL